MSRRKKSRSLKDRLGVKTGSKKTFISQGDKGKIPSKNRLAKHKNRSKSAYAKFLEENRGKDTSAGQGPAKPQKTGVSDDPSENRSEPEPQDELDTADFDELSGDELLERFERS
ncbi:hypothetical protein [Saccharospirillum impatiens]|uniref:hypothetical protein n=1 Tax=Saccharospirillum impatiens TaxID=169438 RepID=UPI0004210A64|nr:hypothetical protein [Saccharospirillum impatiens]